MEDITLPKTLLNRYPNGKTNRTWSRDAWIKGVLYGMSRRNLQQSDREDTRRWQQSTERRKNSMWNRIYKLTPWFMEPRGSMLHSQGLFGNIYREKLIKFIVLKCIFPTSTLVLSLHQHLGLLRSLFPLVLSVKFWKHYHLLSFRLTWTVQLSRFSLRIHILSISSFEPKYSPLELVFKYYIYLGIHIYIYIYIFIYVTASLV